MIMMLTQVSFGWRTISSKHGWTWLECATLILSPDTKQAPNTGSGLGVASSVALETNWTVEVAETEPVASVAQSNK